MIIRIFRVRVFEDRIDDFQDFFLHTAQPLMENQPGLNHLYMGLPRPETPDQFGIVMVWENVEALAAFAGEDWRAPHIHPDEEGIVAERWLDHYDLAV